MNTDSLNEETKIQGMHQVVGIGIEESLASFPSQFSNDSGRDKQTPYINSDCVALYRVLERKRTAGHG